MCVCVCVSSKINEVVGKRQFRSSCFLDEFSIYIKINTPSPKMQSPDLRLLLLLLLLTQLPGPCTAFQLWALDPIQCPGGSPGLAVNVTAKEFYASFASIFKLSDGSTMRPPSAERMESIRYMQELLYSVGISVNESASAAANGMYEGDVLQICGQDVVDLILLSIVGNFVTNPSDPSLSPSTGATSTVPSVVVDTYTGRLVVRMPYDAVRGYFIEALLVISIIVITRLSFVRNVTYKVALPPAPAQQKRL